MADKKIIALTADEAAALRNMLQREARRPSRSPSPREGLADHEEILAPETYVARTPAGGIDAMQLEAGAGVQDVPGYADCDIYQIVHVEGESPYLLPNPAGLSKRTYNLATDRIGGARWVVVHRLKGGHWVAGAIGPDAAIDDTGTGTAPTPCPGASVTERDFRCEAGTLNVYERAIALSIEDGCIVASEGAWALVGNEGACGGKVGEVVEYTNIANFLGFVAGVIYFNAYDATLNMWLNGRWYTWCVCEYGTGTGTGTGTAAAGTGGGGGTVTDGCCNSMPETLTLTIAGGSGDCTCFNGTYTLTWDAVDLRWEGGATGCTGRALSFTFKCFNPTTDYRLTIACEGLACITLTKARTACDPFQWSEAGGAACSPCCTVGLVGTCTVTE